MVKSKTMSVRIDPEIHEMVVEECNIRGCTANEFLDDAILHELEDKTEVLQDRPDEPEKPESPVMEIGKVYDDDGNVVGTIRSNS